MRFALCEIPITDDFSGFRLAAFSKQYANEELSIVGFKKKKVCQGLNLQ
jgi:hypothetical protein